MAKRSRGKFIGILLVAMVAATVLTAGGAAPAAAGTGPAPGRVHKDAGYGGIPLFFIPNEGQLDERVAYAITGRDKSVYFTPDGLTFVLTERTKPAGGRRLLREIQAGRDWREAAGRRWVVKLDFVGARRDARPESLEQAETVVSYFTGRPEEWKTGLRASSRIIYRDLWPGIDLVYYGTVNRLKYEFIVRPGADPASIRLAYRGADRVEVTPEGRLEVATPLGVFRDDIPVAWQEAEGQRQGVTVDYALEEAPEVRMAALSLSATDAPVPPGLDSSLQTRAYGFSVGRYDRSRTLVLDPAMLVYCGYIGGAGDESGMGIAVDGSGNAYITGQTDSDAASFPVAAGPYLTYDGGIAIFVAKVNANGTALEYCGYIGGFGMHIGNGIAVDAAGNAYITGGSLAAPPGLPASLPVTVGPSLTHGGGLFDAFVAKVNPAGTALVYCGYLGGAGADIGYGIAVDAAGNAYVTGVTDSTAATFPVAVGPDLTENGLLDAFVAKVNPAGTALTYCGYIGGANDDNGAGIAVDAAGNAYVTGMTESTAATFPVAVGPDLTENGLFDAFVAKVNPAGTALTYCGYIGGADDDSGRGIAVDYAGSAYVTGVTRSDETTFPVAVGPDLTYNGGTDGFVAKVNPAGTALAYCGYIGGANYDDGWGIAVDRAGNAYVTGDTDSDQTTFPVAVGPGLAYNGGVDAYVAKVKADGTALAYCGYIGGAGDEDGNGIAMDRAGNAYVTGMTESAAATFPVAVGPDRTHNGWTDAFVAKIHDITTDPPDYDNDSVPDPDEQGPGGNDPAYDGNGDGIPDWRQDNVVSFHTPAQDAGSRYVTLAVPPGRRIEYLFTPRAGEAGPPAGVSFPYGLFSFAIGGVPRGGSVVATITLDGPPPQTYYKYGRTPDNPADHWYEFAYDGETGAEAAGDTVVVHFVDGKRGDHDLEANGRITDPGGPAEIASRAGLYFPYLVSTPDEETEIGIINTRSYASQAAISYYGANGDLLRTAPITLRPYGKATISAAGIPPGSASAILSGDGAPVGYTRYVNAAGKRCAWPAATSPQKTLTVPHTAVDAEWATALGLFNPNAGAVEVTLAAESGGASRLTLNPKASKYIPLTETEGVLSISSTGGIAAMELFDSLLPGGDRAALLLQERSLRALSVPSILHGPGEFTGIGLTGWHHGTVTITGHSETGGAVELSFSTQPLGSQSPRSRMAFNLSNMLGEENLWATVSGITDLATPVGTPLLHFQGLAVYGRDNTRKLGALHLNTLQFREGFIGILSPAAETTMTLLNPGTVEATLTATGYNAAGEALAGIIIKIPAGSRWTGTASDLVNGASAAGMTHIRVVSDVDLAGFETISTDGRMEMLPVLAVD